MKNWYILVIIALLFAASFYWGYRYKGDQISPIQTDTLTVIKADTVRITQTKLIKQLITDSIPYKVTDTIRVSDTIWLPRTQKEYGDSSYTAWVSGYDPKLDSINVYNNTIIKTVEKPVFQPMKPKKWGIGVIGGYGMSKSGLSPFVGVGLYYRLF